MAAEDLIGGKGVHLIIRVFLPCLLGHWQHFLYLSPLSLLFRVSIHLARFFFFGVIHLRIVDYVDDHVKSWAMSSPDPPFCVFRVLIQMCLVVAN